METPHLGIFHCLCCGSVVEQDLCRLPPFCCGMEMSKDIGHSVPDDQLHVPPAVAHLWAKTAGSRAAEHEPPPRMEFVLKQPL